MHRCTISHIDPDSPLRHAAHPGDRLVAKAEVMNMKEDRYYIKVIIRSEEAEVFRAKFIIVAVGQEKESREA